MNFLSQLVTEELFTVFKDKKIFVLVIKRLDIEYFRHCLHAENLPQKLTNSLSIY
jgi:hypothetical protein